MTIKLCVGPRCRDYGQHSAESCRDGCTGCQPRPAVIGRLCRVCCRNIGLNAILAARAWTDLETDLVNTSSGGGGGGSSNPFPSVSFDPQASRARAHIHSVLSSWCKLIRDELGYLSPSRGSRFRVVPVRDVAAVPVVRPGKVRVLPEFTAQHRAWRAANSLEALELGYAVQGPQERVIVAVRESGIEYLGDYISQHREWLAGHELAEFACGELADLVHTGLRQQDAVTSGVVELKHPCPECEAPLKGVLRRGDVVPSEVTCEGEARHRWLGEKQIAELGRLIGAQERWPTAREISRRENRPIGTVTRWASVYKWRRTEDHQYPVLYHPEDVEKTIKRLTSEAAA